MNTEEEILTALIRTTDRLEAVLRFEAKGNAPDFIDRMIATHPDLSHARTVIKKHI